MKAPQGLSDYIYPLMDTRGPSARVHTLLASCTDTMWSPKHVFFFNDLINRILEANTSNIRNKMSAHGHSP